MTDRTLPTTCDRRRSLTRIVAVLAILALLALPGLMSDALAADDLEVSFEFAEENRGPDGPSPVIVVKAIPAGTVRLKVALRDRERPTFRHGGGEVAVDGASEFTIPSGALTDSYKGPYPPRHETHRYTFAVSALDAGGKVLATGKAAANFDGK